MTPNNTSKQPDFINDGDDSILEGDNVEVVKGDGRFKKGHTGHGRKPGSGYKEEAKRWVKEEGWSRLIDQARGKPKIVKVIEVRTKSGQRSLKRIYGIPGEKSQDFATELLFAYGIGKPTQELTLNAQGGGAVIQMIFPDGYKQPEALSVDSIPSQLPEEQEQTEETPTEGEGEKT